MTHQITDVDYYSMSRYIFTVNPVVTKLLSVGELFCDCGYNYLNNLLSVSTYQHNYSNNR